MTFAVPPQFAGRCRTSALTALTLHYPPDWEVLLYQDFAITG